VTRGGSVSVINRVSTTSTEKKVWGRHLGSPAKGQKWARALCVENWGGTYATLGGKTKRERTRTKNGAVGSALRLNPGTQGKILVVKKYRRAVKNPWGTKAKAHANLTRGR